MNRNPLDRSLGGEMAGKFQKDDTFVIGITMAGAVSAGAYTAGVLDFLIEALDTWYRAKADPDADVPRHKVCISAMSGTSAGGVCAPLLCAAMAAGDSPTIRRPAGLTEDGTDKQLEIRNYLPRLYEAWVEKPSLLADARGRGFLGLGDLKGAAAIRSLLNSDLLEMIGGEALKLPANGKAKSYPYVSQRLHLFAMVGNARGVPYKIVFDHDNAHGTRLHADRVHVAIDGLGEITDMESVWAAQEFPAVTADVQNLFAADLDSNWSTILQGAMASCAFPAALRSRILVFDHKLWDKRVWPSGVGYVPGATPQTGAYPEVSPNWPTTLSPDWDYKFVNVDGGIANNEPFEYAHYAIMSEDTLAESLRNPSDGGSADRAVIMIDPFPEPPGFEEPDAPKDGLLDSLLVLPGVFLAQARFKTEELMRAAKDDVYSRFLISPWGPRPDGGQDGSTAMSCGGLAGFVGFVEQSFRAHDFQLGRRNCQKFLRDHFCLPCDPNYNNKIIKECWPAPKIADPAWFKNGDKNPGRYAQIVPLCGALGTKVEPRPSWPKTTEANLNKIEDQIEDRLSRVLPTLLGELGVRGGWSIVANLALKFGAKSAIVGKIMNTMRKSLAKQKQI